MKKIILFLIFFCGFSSLLNNLNAQRRTPTRATPRTTQRRQTTRARAVAPATVTQVAPPVAVATPPAGPIAEVKPSLRPDEAVDSKDVKDRTPLAYEHIRIDDAIYRQKLWREIDTREKQNLAFRYNADENNGNQRFISILMKGVQDEKIKVYDAIDDRFTTEYTTADAIKSLTGPPVVTDIYGPDGKISGTKEVPGRVDLNAIVKFRIKEEVIFDKESSRLHWRILGIAPVMKRTSGSLGLDLGETELFWVYYPDVREYLASYEVYNGKNAGARMSWEEFFDGRYFYGRIYKSTLDNYSNSEIKDYKGLGENGILQLLEGERVKEKIFNYEQDLWSY